MSIARRFTHRYSTITSSRSGRWLIVAAVVVMALVLLNAIAALLVQRYVNNNVLNDMGQYTGSVDDVDIQPYAASYTLQNMVLFRKGSDKETPFFSAEQLTVSVSGQALTRGEFLIKSVIQRPVVNLRKAAKAEDQQLGKGTNWLKAFQRLLPALLHELVVVDGTFNFQDIDASSDVNLTASHFNAVMTNLTNTEGKSEPLAASSHAEATVLEDASFDAEAKFNPNNFTDFELTGSITNIALRDVNPYTREYANMDFKTGHGKVMLDVTGDNGKLSGYLKPSFDNVQIVSWEQDVEGQNNNPLQLLWEGGLSLVSNLVDGGENGRIATKIPLDGNIRKANFKSFKAFWGMVTNTWDNSSDEDEKQAGNHESGDDQLADKDR